MSTTTEVVEYNYSSGPGGTTAGGTAWNVELGIFVQAGTDFDDSTAATLHAAIVGALQGAGWSVESGDVSVNKGDATTKGYATDYTASPITFS